MAKQGLDLALKTAVEHSFQVNKMNLAPQQEEIDADVALQICYGVVEDMLALGTALKGLDKDEK